jgi:hypothetical protein
VCGFRDRLGDVRSALQVSRFRASWHSCEGVVMGHLNRRTLDNSDDVSADRLMRRRTDYRAAERGAGRWPNACIGPTSTRFCHHSDGRLLGLVERRAAEHALEKPQ